MLDFYPSTSTAKLCHSESWLTKKLTAKINYAMLTVIEILEFLLHLKDFINFG